MLSPQSAPASAQSRKLTINKYPNRRYYDTTRSRHVTFEQIYSLIRDGYEVQVTDSRTRQDITARVLTQILIDLDPQKLKVFPLPMLHRLLRASPERINDAVVKQLSQSLNALLPAQADSRPDSADERR